MNDTTKNTALWIVLIIMIIASSLLADNNLKLALYIIPLASIIKFLGISFQFMEAKGGHRFWKFLLIIFTIIYTIGALAFY